MSQENVEVVRGIYALWPQRDNVTPFEVYAADIVFDLSNTRRAALGMVIRMQMFDDRQQALEAAGLRE